MFKGTPHDFQHDPIRKRSLEKSVKINYYIGYRKSYALVWYHDEKILLEPFVTGIMLKIMITDRFAG